MAPRSLHNLVAVLGFLQIAHAQRSCSYFISGSTDWLGVGLIAVGVERQGYLLSLSHIAEGEWRAQFSAHPMWVSVGFGVAATPWRAVQQAAWTALKRPERAATLARKGGWRDSESA